jgi:hypothetical protein
MKRAVLFSLAILIAAFLCAIPDAQGDITAVQVTPAEPTTVDEVSVHVSGDFLDSCWTVTGEALDRHGIIIDILVRATDSWTHQSDLCGDAPVHYDSVYSLGLLEEGIYFVTVVEDHDSQRETPDTSILQFRVDAPTASDPSDPGSLPNRFALQQNHPNPFNAATTIAFTLERADRVRLVIYDLLGRRVKTIMDEDLSSGSHTAAWDGKDDYGADVTTGVYFYRLTAGNQVSSRKMVLLK